MMMRPKQFGRFDHLKWRCALTASFPGSIGGKNSGYTWQNAVLDTASPIHALPGSGASFPDVAQLRDFEKALVEIRLTPSTAEVLSISCNGMYPAPIGGIEAVPQWRQTFLAVLEVPGISQLDFAPVIFMDIPHPIISVGLCVKSGMRFTFDANGFSVR